MAVLKFKDSLGVWHSIPAIQGEQGIQGVAGADGAQGPAGEALTILGTLSSVGDLPLSGNVGDAYLISGDLHIWVMDEWENVGNIQGPQGIQGEQGLPGDPGAKGDPGDDGASAYVHIKYSATNPDSNDDMTDTPSAWMGVYSGTSATAPVNYTDYDWYQIKGATGSTGPAGADGAQGPAGEALTILGTLSSVGDLPLSGNVGDAYLISGDLHIWVMDEWENVGNIQGPQGIQGEQGLPGDPGAKGDPGDDGASAYVHIKYSATEPTADGDMTDTPSAWMGVYSGTSETAPTDYALYNWNNITNVVNVKSFGATGDGVTDDTAAIQAAILYVESTGGQYTRKCLMIDNGEYLITGLTISSGMSVLGEGRLTLDASGTVALTVATTNSSFERLYINLTADNQKGIVMDNGAGTSPQLNVFKNIYVNGNNKAETIALEIKAAYVNSFYDCKFFWTTYGVAFTGPSANANFFHGCEIRASTGVDAGLSVRAIVHNAGEVNVFQSCVIENQISAIEMNGGSLYLDGCYTEGFLAGRPFVMNDGLLNIKNTLLKGLFLISGGKSLTIEGCDIPATSTSTTFPFIRYEADCPTIVTMKDNVINAALIHSRYGEYFTGSAWAARSAENIHETYLDRGQVYHGAFPAASNVTGDGTSYTLLTTSEANPYGELADATGLFTPIDNGLYEFTAKVTLNGLTANHTACELILFRAGTFYSLLNITGVTPAVVQENLSGSIITTAVTGGSWRFIVNVAGTGKVVDINSGHYSIRRLA